MTALEMPKLYHSGVNDSSGRRIKLILFITIKKGETPYGLSP